MSKTLSAEAEHKPYFTTKRMALIGVMTAVTCILGPFSIPLPYSRLIVIIFFSIQLPPPCSSGISLFFLSLV